MNTTFTLFIRKSIKLKFKILFCLFIGTIPISYAQDSCLAHFTAVRTPNNNKTFIITNQSTGSNLVYLWDFGDGQTSSNANPGTHTYATSGTYIIGLRINDSVGHCFSGYTDTLYSFCSANFSCTSFSNDKLYWSFHPNLIVDSATTLFTWNFGDGASSASVHPTHQYALPGTYIVSLTTRSTIDTSCTDTQSRKIVIRDPAGCVANFTFSLDSVDVHTIHLTNLSTGFNLTYLWDFGDGQTSSLASPGSHTYANGGKYLVSLNVVGEVPECNSGIGKEVMVIGDCSALFASYQLYGYTYQFNAAQTTGATFFWDFGDGTTDTSVNSYILHSFPDNQFYNVCLKVTSTVDSTCKNTYCNFINVNLNQYCHALFSVAADSSTTDTTDFIIYNLSTGNNLSYHWDFGDGTTSTLENPTHDYLGDGPYSVHLKVENDSCTSFYSDTIYFPPIAHLLPSKWHIKVVNKNVTTGILKNESETLTLQNYPNPFTGSTTIKYNLVSASPIELSIYNLLGSRIEVIETVNKSPGNYSKEWDARNLREGIYLLQLKTNDQVITKKIILTK